MGCPKSCSASEFDHWQLGLRESPFQGKPSDPRVLPFIIELYAKYKRESPKYRVVAIKLAKFHNFFIQEQPVKAAYQYHRRKGCPDLLAPAAPAPSPNKPNGAKRQFESLLKGSKPSPSPPACETCQQCKRQLNRSFVYCPGCGSRRAIVCCGITARPDHLFCPRCGKAHATAKADAGDDWLGASADNKSSSQSSEEPEQEPKRSKATPEESSSPRPVRATPPDAGSQPENSMSEPEAKKRKKVASGADRSSDSSSDSSAVVEVSRKGMLCAESGCPAEVPKGKIHCSTHGKKKSDVAIQFLKVAELQRLTEEKYRRLQDKLDQVLEAQKNSLPLKAEVRESLMQSPVELSEANKSTRAFRGVGVVQSYTDYELECVKLAAKKEEKDRRHDRAAEKKAAAAEKKQLAAAKKAQAQSAKVQKAKAKAQAKAQRVEQAREALQKEADEQAAAKAAAAAVVKDLIMDMTVVRPGSYNPLQPGLREVERFSVLATHPDVGVAQWYSVLDFAPHARSCDVRWSDHADYEAVLAEAHDLRDNFDAHEAKKCSELVCHGVWTQQVQNPLICCNCHNRFHRACQPIGANHGEPKTWTCPVCTGSIASQAKENEKRVSKKMKVAVALKLQDPGDDDGDLSDAVLAELNKPRSERLASTTINGALQARPSPSKTPDDADEDNTLNDGGDLSSSSDDSDQ